MQRRWYWIAAAAALLGWSCGVPQEEMDTVEAALLACEDDKIQAQAAVQAWESRFDREASRWEVMEATVSESLPRAMSEFHAERDRIIELVPDQVQAEVEAYLEDYFTTVMTGFDRLVSDNKEIRYELKATQKVLENIGSNTREISSSIDGALAAERQSRLEERRRRLGERQRRQDVSAGLAELVALISEWDRTRLDCRDCPERVKLKDRQREPVAAFHAELVSRLADLQSFADAADPEDSGEADDPTSTVSAGG